MSALPPFLLPALRGLIRRPMSTLLALLMLALGIGASTAVFSIMAPALLSPTGLGHSDRMMEVFRSVRGEMGGVTFSFERGLSHEELRTQQGGNPSIAALANASFHRFVARAGEQEARYLQGSVITSDYFKVTGVSPALGRPFTPEEDRMAEPEVLISHTLWLSLYGGERGALGRMLHVNGHPCRVVGVMPRSFLGHRLGERLDLWLPEGTRQRVVPSDPDRDPALSSSEPTLARLHPKVSVAQAEAAFQSIGAGFRDVAERPGTQVSAITLRPFDADRGRALEGRLPAPWLMLAVAGSLLLLACANVANLQLAQLEARRQEFATRISLGARPSTIVRGVLGENLLLSTLAGLLGLALAKPFMQGLLAIRDVKVYETPLLASLSVEAFLFATLLVVFAGLAVGLLPALQASRVQLAQALKDTSGALARGGRLKDALVVVQVALALALIAGGTLVGRGLNRARGTALGYRTAGVAGARIEFPDSWPKARRGEALQTLRDRVAALPSVRSASWAEGLPMEEGNLTVTMIQGMRCRLQGVGPGYFSTLGLSILQGREFTASDLGRNGRLANQALAQWLWPGQDPLDRLVNERQLIGVVADHAQSPEEGLHEPVFFRPIPPEGGTCLLFRSEVPPETLFPSVRRILRGIDPDLPLLQLTTLEAHLDRLHHDLRVASWLLGFCGVVSLVLSAMGVQSLLVFRVARQSREIGLRMALGGARQDILRLVILQGMRSVLAGLALGCLGAFWVGKTFNHLFVGLAPFDPASLLTALGVLLAASLIACLIPALRAASLDPARALRQD